MTPRPRRYSVTSIIIGNSFACWLSRRLAVVGLVHACIRVDHRGLGGTEVVGDHVAGGPDLPQADASGQGPDGGPFGVAEAEELGGGGQFAVGLGVDDAGLGV